MPHRRILGAIPALVIALLIASPTASAATTHTSSQAAGSGGHSARPHHMMRPLSRGIPAARRPLAPAAPSTPGSKVALSGGLNQPGLGIADDGLFPSTPPDPTGAIGPDHYVEMVNSAIGVYDRTTLAPVASTSLDNWLNDPTGFLCDPQIQWDAASNRWLFVVLKCGTGDQGFFFGWSKTPDSSNLASGWCVFTQTTTNRLPDYPKVGHSAGYMMVGANEYNSASLAFISAAIFWMPTPAPGVTTCTAPTVQKLGGTKLSPLTEGDGLTPAFTPVPVNTMTTAADGYVISAYDPGFATPSLGIWHLDSSGVLHQQPDIPVGAYAYPNTAPNAGSSVPYDTLNGQLTMAVGDPALGMYTQHTVDGPGGRSVMRWYELTVASPGGAPLLAQEGTISSTTDFVFNGAIAPRLDGKGAAAFYNRASSTLTPVIAAQIRISSTPPGAMEPGELVLGTSSGNDQDFSCIAPTSPCRWGDYSGASPDPNNPQAVWGTNEALGVASPGNATWFTRNWSVLVAVAPHAPTAVTATAGDRSATVSWTPSNFDAGTPDIGYLIKAYVGVTSVASKIVGAGVTSAVFAGLTDGTTYTFTVTAGNLVGAGPESAPSNPVTPERAGVGGAPPASPSPTRPPVVQSSPAPTPTPR